MSVVSNATTFFSFSDGFQAAEYKVHVQLTEMSCWMKHGARARSMGTTRGKLWISPRRKRGEGRALTLKVKGYREFSGWLFTSNHDAPPMTLSIFSETL